MLNRKDAIRIERPVFLITGKSGKINSSAQHTFLDVIQLDVKMNCEYRAVI